MVVKIKRVTHCYQHNPDTMTSPFAVGSGHASTHVVKQVYAVTHPGHANTARNTKYGDAEVVALGLWKDRAGRCGRRFSGGREHSSKFPRLRSLG
jgi:hypothetical protein